MIGQYRRIHSSPIQLKGNMIIEDNKLPQKLTQFTALARLFLPTPSSKQGHKIELTIDKITAGIPSTTNCKIDKVFAIHLVHFWGLIRWTK